MELSSLYTRRLSGSYSSRNSFNEDALEQLEFNINDISRASSPASITSVSARSEGFRERRHRSSGRNEDEYRRRYSKVRGELEQEKVRARILHQEKEEEIRKVKDALENERRLALISLQNRLEEEKKRELARLKEELIKQKDFELQQVLMYKESEKKSQSSHKAEDKADKPKNKIDEPNPEEKDKNEVDEDDGASGGRDGDNDVAVLSERGRAKDQARDERRRHKSGAEKRTVDDDEEVKNADAGTPHGPRRSNRTPRSQRGVDGYEGDKESHGGGHRRRGHSSKTTERAERGDPSGVADKAETVEAAARDNTRVTTVKTSHVDGLPSPKYGVTSTAETNPKVGIAGVSSKEEAETVPTKESTASSSPKKENKENEGAKKERENEKTLELEEKIKALEDERSSLLKRNEDIQRSFEMKIKEHKIREEEFVSLKAGYDRELRTVINEHKKVALGNLEKLKQAETALKQATISDEEIAILTQRHEQRRLSTTSLPGLPEETRREDREREKSLQKKLGDLTTQIQRLERRITLLRTENDTLRKKQDDQRPLEEKIKSLKKRNAELAAIARRLEEKAKLLQQENSKVKSKTPFTRSQDDGDVEAEHLKRLFARQRAKDLAEHAKNMLAKDKELEELRRKCQELADLLSNGEVMAPVNAAQFEEKDELVNIIKQAAKERLQLEQQLAHSRTREKNPESDDVEHQFSTNDRHKHELEAANQILHNEIEKLESALKKAEHLEEQLTEKSTQCQTLTKELAVSRKEKDQLQSQLELTSAQKDELASEVEDLRVKVKSLDEITEECNTLKISLATAQREREVAHEEVQHLNLRVHSLENLVRDLQESAESVSQVDNERKAALAKLQDKQAELEQLHKASSSVESEHSHLVTKLNQQVQELEEKRRKEEERREELAKEVQRLKREAEERQKVLEEAERLKEELARIKQEASESILVPSPSQSQLLARVRHKGEETDEEEEYTQEGMERKAHIPNDRPVTESFLSAWAQKGPIQVYIAKYNYDPFEFSPNENPEAELPLTAGDYVLVVGEMDEDGFFDGELIDGRQGLVPSNFIEKVEDEDLSEFHAALLQAGHGDYSNPAAASNSPVTINNKLNNNNNDVVFAAVDAKTDVQNGAGSHPEESNSDLEDIAEIDEDTASLSSRILSNGGTINNLPPSPRGLSLDRQLTNSLLVSWKEPEPAPGLEVQSYHIFVDGQFKTSVKSNERTKALLEGVNTNTSHRVCVRCLSNKGQSKDAQCTMLVGKDIYPLPSELKVCHVSPTSAALSWLPGDSNYQHAIVVNGKEVRVVKPGIFRHTLTGLTPGTMHRVTLIAKSIPGALIEEKSRKWVENVSASIDFHTPEAGAPEPPLNVQVESGPREGTILLTWLPVTINSSGVCNGAVVAGYQVMADSRRVKNIPGPTSDHAVLSFEDFKGLFPSHLCVRTVSTSGVESVNSDMVSLPGALIKELKEGYAKSKDPNLKSSDRGKSSKSQADDGKGHDTDEEIEAAFRDAQSSSDGGVNAIMGDPYSDTSSSELSDIPEVEEDLIGSQDSHLNEVGMSRTNQTASYSQAEKRSPQPAPRKLASVAADSQPKDFHDQKPKGDLTSSARVVPAIEITRDSSTEQGTSLDDEPEEGSAASTANTPMSSNGRPTDSVISRHYWDDSHNPSAFRQVDQTRRHDTAESVRPDGKGVDGFQSNSPGGKNPNFQPPSKSHIQDSVAGSEVQNLRQTTRSMPTHNPDHRKHLAQSSSLTMDEGGDTDSISGEINPVVDENSVRLFIALFDYDPATMSPNVDSIDEELPFKEGQILKVFGDKDADGFYKGESHGRKGFIPCNMVSEVQIDDPDLVEQLLKETTERPVSSQPSLTSATRDMELTPNGMVQIPREGSMRRMVAMYDYDPQELSPNVDAELELSFKTGDIVLIYGDMDEDGFFTGEVNGQHGLVPSNFLQPAPLSDDEGLESVSVVSAPRSRSGESLDAAINSLGRTDLTSNASRLNDQVATKADLISSNKQASNINVTEGNKSDGSRPGTASPADEEKPKKKGGFLNKSKNIFKKFTR